MLRMKTNGTNEMGLFTSFQLRAGQYDVGI